MVLLSIEGTLCVLAVAVLTVAFLLFAAKSMGRSAAKELPSHLKARADASAKGELWRWENDEEDVEEAREEAPSD